MTSFHFRPTWLTSSVAQIYYYFLLFIYYFLLLLHRSMFKLPKYQGIWFYAWCVLNIDDMCKAYLDRQVCIKLSCRPVLGNKCLCPSQPKIPAVLGLGVPALLHKHRYPFGSFWASWVSISNVKYLRIRRKDLWGIKWIYHWRWHWEHPGKAK